MARPINVRLILDALGFVRGAKAAGKETDKLGSRFDRLAKGGLKGMVGAIAGGTGALLLLRRAFQGVANTVRLAGIQDITDKKLSQAIKNTGESIGEQLPLFKEQASALQSISNFGDEATLTAQSLLLASDQLNSEGVRVLTPGMLDLAAAMQKVDGGQVDLSTTARLLTQVMAGTTGQLSRYGIKLSEADEAQLQALEGMERATFVAGILEKRFGGLAEATADPFVQMSNAVGDLREEFGAQLLPVLRDAARRFTEFASAPGTIDAVREAAEKLAEAFGVVVDQISDSESATRKLADALIDIGRIASEVLGPINKGFGELDKIAVQIRNDLLSIFLALRNIVTFGGGGGILDLTKLFEGLAGSQKGVVEGFQEINELLKLEAEAAQETGAAFTPPPLPPSDDIQKALFARRELEIQLMRESEAKIRAATQLEFDKRRAQFRKLFDGLPADVAEMLDQLQEQTESELVRRFRASLIVDVELSPDIELPEGEVDIPEATFEDLRDLVENNLLQTVVEIDVVLAQLNEMFGNVDTQEARAEIGRLIDSLENARTKFIDAGKDISLNVGEIAADVVTAVAAAVGSGENIGDALLQSLGALAERVGKLAIAFGLAGIGIKKIAFGNPIAAVVAGAALVALGKRAQAAVGRAVGSDTGTGAPSSTPRETAPGTSDLVLERTIILPGRASGGPVRRGQTVIVGEQAPELFTPLESGFILPPAAITSDIPLAFGNDAVPGLMPVGGVEGPSGRSAHTGEQATSERMLRGHFTVDQIVIGMEELAIQLRQVNEVQNDLQGRD